MRLTPLQIGDWQVRPDLNELTRGAIRVRLEPKAMATLLVLADRPGDVITKAELLERVWPGTFVVDGAVFRVLSELRRALGDDPRTPTYVETIPNRGYRLVASRHDRGAIALTVHAGLACRRLRCCGCAGGDGWCCDVDVARHPRSIHPYRDGAGWLDA